MAVEEISLGELRRRTSAKWRTYPPDVLPLPVAEMDFRVAAPVAEALHAAIGRSDLGYANPSSGLPEALAGFAARRWGWQLDPAQVTLAPEVGVAVVEVLRLLVRPGDGVVINPPVYDSFFPWLAEVGCQLVEVPLAQTGDGWALDLDAMQSAFRDGARVHLLCSPHNPTGTVHHRQDLERLATLAAGYGVTVLADEIHAPLVLPGRTHHPFLSVSPEAAGHGIVFTSASKAWNLAGLKSAVIVTADAATRRLVERLPEELPWRAGHLGVLASIAAFTEGEPWLEEVLAVLDHHRRYLAKLLAARIPAIRYRPPDASYLAWLDCTALGLGDDPSAVFLAKGRVALSSGPSFGRPGVGHARLNMGHQPADPGRRGRPDGQRHRRLANAEAGRSRERMPTPFDYETNPERFRLATRVTSQHLTAARSLYELLAEELTQLDPRRILDIGCGEGALRSALPARLASRTVGLDASVTMLGAHPPPVVQADATALPFMVGVFDVAVAVNVLGHLADPTVAIGEAHRVLAPGGTLIAATASRHDSPELAHVRRPPPSTFDAEDAPELLASVFGQVRVQRWDAPMIRLPDRDALRDYLLARFAAREVAATAAEQVTVPMTVTKRGAVIYARK